MSKKTTQERPGLPCDIVSSLFICYYDTAGYIAITYRIFKSGNTSFTDMQLYDMIKSKDIVSVLLS